MLYRFTQTYIYAESFAPKIKKKNCFGMPSFSNKNVIVNQILRIMQSIFDGFLSGLYDSAHKSECIREKFLPPFYALANFYP